MELTGAYYTRGLRAGLEQASQRLLIESCDDLARLESWLDQALTATSAAQLFD